MTEQDCANGDSFEQHCTICQRQIANADIAVAKKGVARTMAYAILAVDQASASGWAIYDGAKIAAWGLAKKASDRQAVIDNALLIAREAGLRLLVVMEDHSKIPLEVGTKHDRKRGGPRPIRRNTGTIIGIGDARGRWLEQLELAGHPEAWVMFVEPSDWRQKTIGNYGGSDAIKKRAVDRAGNTLGVTVPNHNTAEAVVMLEWSTLDGRARFDAAREAARAVRRKAAP